MKKHPAKFSAELLPAIERLINHYGVYGYVLDPFAGVGTIHQVSTNGLVTFGVELEPEWATQHPDNVIGDATALPFQDESFDGIITSPCYGNRMADSHDAQDGSYRLTYTHTLGRKLHKNNSGAMQWGTRYKIFHQAAWEESVRVLSEWGIFILNIKDHQRDGKRIHVANWHFQTLKKLGLVPIHVSRVQTPGFKYGENRHRYPERLLVMQKRTTVMGGHKMSMVI